MIIKKNFYSKLNNRNNSNFLLQKELTVDTVYPNKLKV